MKKEKDFSKYTRSECLSIARALREYEIELQYYIRIFSILYGEKHLMIKRLRFNLEFVKKEQEKIYHLYKNDKYSSTFISLCGFYD